MLLLWGPNSSLVCWLISWSTVLTAADFLSVNWKRGGEQLLWAITLQKHSDFSQADETNHWTDHLQQRGVWLVQLPHSEIYKQYFCIFVQTCSFSVTNSKKHQTELETQRGCLCCSACFLLYVVEIKKNEALVCQDEDRRTESNDAFSVFVL